MTNESDRHGGAIPHCGMCGEQEWEQTRSGNWKCGSCDYGPYGDDELQAELDEVMGGDEIPNEVRTARELPDDVHEFVMDSGIVSMPVLERVLDDIRGEPVEVGARVRRLRQRSNTGLRSRSLFGYPESHRKHILTNLKELELADETDSGWVATDRGEHIVEAMA